MTEEDLDRVVEVIMRYGARRREGRGERKEGIGK
jgi:hypothetical protein